MQLSIVLTIGKYLLLGGLYAFVLVVFRGMIRQIAAESARPREGRRSRAMRREGQAQRRVGRVPERPRMAATAASVVTEPATKPSPEPIAAAAPQPELAAGISSEAEQRAAPEEDHSVGPHLYVLESGDDALQAGHVVPLTAAVTIGRSEENSLRVADRYISSRHALICLREGRRILVDRGSTNGTFVNGVRVEKEIELNDGDRIAMGNTVFEYRTG